MSSSRLGLPRLLNHEIFGSNSLNNQPAGPVEKTSSSKYKFFPSKKAMESTDLSGCSKARDLDHRQHVPAKLREEEKHNMASSVERIQEDTESNADSVNKRVMNRTVSHYMTIANLVAACESIAFSVFGLIFTNVQLGGDWHVASRKLLANTMPIIWLIQALFVSLEIIGTAYIGSRYTEERRHRHDVGMLLTSGVQLITAAFRVVAPLIGAIIVVAHG